MVRKNCHNIKSVGFDAIFQFYVKHYNFVWYPIKAIGLQYQYNRKIWQSLMYFSSGYEIKDRSLSQRSTHRKAQSSGDEFNWKRDEIIWKSDEVIWKSGKFIWKTDEFIWKTDKFIWKTDEINWKTLCEKVAAILPPLQMTMGAVAAILIIQCYGSYTFSAYGAYGIWKPYPTLHSAHFQFWGHAPGTYNWERATVYPLLKWLWTL